LIEWERNKEKKERSHAGLGGGYQCVLYVLHHCVRKRKKGREKKGGGKGEGPGVEANVSGSSSIFAKNSAVLKEKKGGGRGEKRKGGGGLRAAPVPPLSLYLRSFYSYREKKKGKGERKEPVGISISLSF